MIKAVKQKGIIGKTGKLEIQTEDIPEGTEVEVIILVDSSETDATEYLLSTEANKRKLLEAIDRVENNEDLVIINSEEWHEKYSI